MKLNPTVETALNRQYNNELTAGYNYLAMANYFETRNLRGFAHWFHAQSEEEQRHAMKLRDYVLLREGSVSMANIPAPKQDFVSVAEVIATALSQEMQVSEDILALHALATENGDMGAANFLNWFVSEQEEEEDNFRNLQDDVAAAGEDAWHLRGLDKGLSRSAE